MLEFWVEDHSGGEVVIHVRGELAERDWTADLKDFLEEHYVDDGVRRIRLDLSEISRIDVGGIATLGVLRAEALRRSKSLVARHARGPARDALRRSGMLRYLEPDEEP